MWVIKDIFNFLFEKKKYNYLQNFLRCMNSRRIAVLKFVFNLFIFK